MSHELQLVLVAVASSLVTILLRRLFFTKRPSLENNVLEAFRPIAKAMVEDCDDQIAFVEQGECFGAVGKGAAAERLKQMILPSHTNESN